VKVAVVGGGITGLAAAWALTHAPGTEVDVTVFEPGRLGGKLQTEDFCGHPVDLGPDAFIARVPHAADLCRELGLADELVAPSAGRALLWTGGRLRPLPDGLMLGAPVRLAPLLRSGLLSPAGLARAALDVVLPRRPLPDDLSVAELAAGRFGAQVADRLVDPLVGGIHAGRTERLSAAATTPQLLSAARSSRSLLRGLARAAEGAHGGGPLFLAPRGGMQVMADRLVAALTGRGVTFVRDAATAIHRLPGDQVRLDPGAAVYDTAILAIPAAAAARLLSQAAPEVAAALRSIRTASVVLATVAFSAADLDIPAGTSGFLVPRGEGRLTTACSFGSRKWPRWSDPGTMVLRVSAGRAGDHRPDGLDDSRLVEMLTGEVTAALGSPATPHTWRVNRWPDSFPQYEVGHPAFVAGIEAALRRAVPAVLLAGASYHGSGIAACVASGRRAASLAAGTAQRERPRRLGALGPEDELQRAEVTEQVGDPVDPRLVVGQEVRTAEVHDRQTGSLQQTGQVAPGEEP